MLRLSAFALVSTLCLTLGNAQTADPGKAAFDNRCEQCHVTDGTGGGHGPSIVDGQPFCSHEHAQRFAARVAQTKGREG